MFCFFLGVLSRVEEIVCHISAISLCGVEASRETGFPRCVAAILVFSDSRVGPLFYTCESGCVFQNTVACTIADMYLHDNPYDATVCLEVRVRQGGSPPARKESMPRLQVGWADLVIAVVTFSLPPGYTFQPFPDPIWPLKSSRSPSAKPYPATTCLSSFAA